VVYARTLGSTTYTFQVSGMLWRNSLIMRDRETGSLWSHITGRAIAGPARGAVLPAIDSVQTTWAKWLAEHPETLLLAKTEEVSSSHYKRYFEDPERMGLFRAQWLMDVMPGKTLVYGVVVGAHAAAVTEQAFSSRPALRVELGDAAVIVSKDADGGVRARLDGEDGDAVPVTPVYWFAWSNFYPNTQVVE
jgi:hypothetical protein